MLRHTSPGRPAGRRLFPVLRIFIPVLLLAVPAAADDPPRWAPLGPAGGQGSAVFALELEPGLAYAGMSDGGVFRSLDGGVTWQPFSQGITVARVNAFDQASDGTLFAATNRGIYRLGPGATVWQAGDGLPASFPYASDVKVDPSTPGRIYATISNGFITGSWSLFRSEDGGESWSKVPDSPFIGSTVWVSDTTPATVFVGGFSGVHQSDNGGASWQNYSAGLPDFPVFRQLIGHPADTEILYVSLRDNLNQVGGIFPYRSDDGGRSWRKIAQGLPGFHTSFPDGVLAVDSGSPDSVYFTGGQGVFRSDDRGDSWQPASTAPGNIGFESLTIFPDGSLLAASHDRDGVVRSPDGGASWQAIESGFLGVRVKAISPDAVIPGRVVAIQRDQILYSGDDGQIWNSAVGGELVDSGTPVFIRDPETPTTILAPAVEGLLRSVDSGISWQHHGPTISSGIDSLVRDPADGALLRATDGQIFRSDDAGLSWSAVSDQLCTDLHLAQPHGATWLAGCTGSVFLPSSKSLPSFQASLLRSIDGGTSWTVVQDGLRGLFSGYWRFSEASAASGAGASGPIFASLIDPAGGWVLRSDDAGATWTWVEALQHDRIESMIDDRRLGRILAGTSDRGVLVSRDDGASWQTLNDGLLSGRVRSLALDAKDAVRIWAATSGGAHLYAGALPEPENCAPSDRVLCLLDRFQVEVSWTDFEDRTGQGMAVPITQNTGAFWFFGEDNLEFALKILDGRSFNGHFWLFYGGLSTVRYTLTVTDLVTGRVRVVENTSGELTGGADTSAFPDPGQPGDSGAQDLLAKIDPEPLRLQGDRFELEVQWRTNDGAQGTAGWRQLTPDTGAFYFFDPDNLEIFAKVLDGRGFNGRFWLFFTGLSNVSYDLVVTDTETGASRTYSNNQGEFGGLFDIDLF